MSVLRSQRASQGCFCQKYLDCLSENARLKAENERLKAKLARQELATAFLLHGICFIDRIASQTIAKQSS